MMAICLVPAFWSRDDVSGHLHATWRTAVWIGGGGGGGNRSSLDCAVDTLGWGGVGWGEEAVMVEFHLAEKSNTTLT